MPRRTGFAMPSIARELNFADWLWRQRRFSIHSRKPPVAGPVAARGGAPRHLPHGAAGDVPVRRRVRGRIPVRLRGSGMVLARPKERDRALHLSGRARVQAGAAVEGRAFAGTLPRAGSLEVALPPRHARGGVCAGVPCGARGEIARRLARRGRHQRPLLRRLGTPGEPGGRSTARSGNRGPTHRPAAELPPMSSRA